jgi:hypothetical protein
MAAPSERRIISERMRTRHRLTAASVALATLALACGTASAAPTLQADHQCYAADRDIIGLAGSGYTPGGQVALFFASSSGGFGQSQASAGADGSFQTTVLAPSLGAFNAWPPGFTLNITANDTARPGAADGPAVAATSVTVADWWVDVPPWGGSPAYARPRRMTTVSAYGWTTLGTTLYVHYVRDRRLIRTLRLGELTGACGSLSLRMRQFPFRPVKAGTYRVQFDTTRAYRRKDSWTAYPRVTVRAKDAVR